MRKSIMPIVAFACLTAASPSRAVDATHWSYVSTDHSGTVVAVALSSIVQERAAASGVFRFRAKSAAARPDHLLWIRADCSRRMFVMLPARDPSGDGAQPPPPRIPAGATYRSAVPHTAGADITERLCPTSRSYADTSRLGPTADGSLPPPPPSSPAPR